MARGSVEMNTQKYICINLRKFVLAFGAGLFFSQTVLADVPLADSFTWDPEIRSDCRAHSAPQSQSWIENSVGADCLFPNSKRGPLWIVSTSHEGSNFEQGSMYDFPMSGGGPFSHTFSKKSDGRYRVSWILDKISMPNYITPTGEYPGRPLRNGFTGAFLNDNPTFNGGRVFNLSEELYFEVDVKLNSVQFQGAAEARVLFGAVATWSGRPHYVEVNLMRTEGFDRCKPDSWFPTNQAADYGVSTCDSVNGPYDHRHHGNPNLGHPELVYLNGQKLPGAPQAELVPGGGWVHFRIPISQIYRQYNWFDAPGVAWSEVKDLSFYFGVEVKDLSTVSMEFENYKVYRGTSLALPTPAPTPVSRGVVPAFTMPTILDGQVSGGQLFDSGSDQQLLLNVYADQWNPASIVHSKIYTRGSSGISFSLPARLRDGNLHTLYFATSTRDNSFNVVLGSQSFTWAVAPVLPSFRNPQAPLSSPNGNRTCAFAGQTLASGSSIKAYSQNVDRGSRTCMSQVRTCLNGVLSGSYTYSSCRTR